MQYLATDCSFYQTPTLTAAARNESNAGLITSIEEEEEGVTELKMLRFSLGVTRMDKTRNEYIRGTAQVGKFGEKTRESRLRWYGLPGKRKRGRPKRMFMDVMKEDMAEVDVTEEDTVGGTENNCLSDILDMHNDEVNEFQIIRRLSYYDYDKFNEFAKQNKIALIF